MTDVVMCKTNNDIERMEMGDGRRPADMVRDNLIMRQMQQ